MLAGIIGNKLAAAQSKIVLAPTKEIPNRMGRKIERQGEDMDAVRVLPINHWDVENQQTQSNTQRRGRVRSR